MDNLKFYLIGFGFLLLLFIGFLLVRDPIVHWMMKPYTTDMVEPVTKEIIRVLRDEGVLR